MTLITSPITSITLAGDTLDTDAVEWAVQVEHGRNDITATPGPSSAQVVILQTGANTITGQVGDALVITAHGAPRFTGVATDIDIAHLPGDVPLTRVTVLAIGHLSRLGSLTDGGSGFPAESVEDRVTGIMDATGLGYVAHLDPDLNLIEDTGTTRTVLDLLNGINESAGGTLADLPNGDILLDSYTTRAWDYQPPPWGDLVGLWSAQSPDWEDLVTAVLRPPAPVELPAAGVLWEPVWKQTNLTVLNDVTVAYGTADPQLTVNVDDATSKARYKIRALVLPTALADSDDATLRAGNIIAAQAQARWSLQQVSIMLDLLDTDTRAAVLGLVSGHRVVVTGLPTPAPSPQYLGVVEGYGESITPAGHVLTLSLSDPRYSYAMLLWEDVTVTVEWDEVNPARVWADVITAADL